MWSLRLKILTSTPRSVLLGHSVTGGVLIKKSTDTAPYVALGFKSKKSNGSYRYVWLYKGKLRPAGARVPDCGG